MRDHHVRPRARGARRRGKPAATRAHLHADDSQAAGRPTALRRQAATELSLHPADSQGPGVPL